MAIPFSVFSLGMVDQTRALPDNRLPLSPWGHLTFWHPAGNNITCRFSRSGGLLGECRIAIGPSVSVITMSWRRPWHALKSCLLTEDFEILGDFFPVHSKAKIGELIPFHCCSNQMCNKIMWSVQKRSRLQVWAGESTSWGLLVLYCQVACNLPCLGKGLNQSERTHLVFNRWYSHSNLISIWHHWVYRWGGLEPARNGLSTVVKKRRIEEKLGVRSGLITSNDIGGLWKLCQQELALPDAANLACSLFSADARLSITYTSP